MQGHLNCGPNKLWMSLQALEDSEEHAGHDRRPNDLVSRRFEQDSLGASGVLRLHESVQNCVPPVTNGPIKEKTIHSQPETPAAA